MVRQRTRSTSSRARWASPRIYAALLHQETGGEWLAEHRFHPVRCWRFDFACPALRVAVEIDGGVWTMGRHNRPSGYVRDMDKFNAAARMGWVVLKFTPQQQWTAGAIDMVRETCAARRGIEK